MTMSQNVQRVSHVVIVVRPENHEAAVRTYSSVLGVDFETKHFDHLRVHCSASWESGLEILSPYSVDDETGCGAVLRRKGEGFHSVVFGVSDVGAAQSRAEENGASCVGRFDAQPALWPEHFKVLEGVQLADMHGVTIVLGQLEPEEGTDTH